MALLPLASPADLAEALSADRAVIYKHSPVCSLSFIAHRELSRFADSRQDVPVYLLDVLRNRSLSDGVESRLDVRHESPQVIVLCRGRAVFDSSHMGVRRSALEQLAVQEPCFANRGTS